MRRSSRRQRILKIALLFVAGSALYAAASEVKIDVTSSAFAAGQAIPTQFSCKGENMNPPLEIHGVPSTGKSLVLIVDDPDAPGGLFTHWMVWNIDPSTSGIAQKNVPAGGVEGTNDFGQKGYGGPCPPSGTHRYIFHVLVLDQKLDLRAGAKRSALNKATAGHVIAHGELTGRFSH
jgi:hypothetical protein